MAAQPSYAGTPIAGAATLTVGDASRTAPAAAGILVTPGAGGLIERVTIIPLATTVASVLRLFRYDGAAYHLYTEIAIPVQTVSASVAVSPLTLQAVDYPNLFPIVIPAGWSLRASINDNQTGVKVHAEGGGF